MKTIMADSNAMIPAVRVNGHRNFYLNTIASMGYKVLDKVAGKRDAVMAYINHGRWVADCPGCPSGSGAENVTLDDPVFMCLSCGNSLVGGKLRPVIFPDEEARVKIEQALAQRPLPNRNWFPDESREKLLLENHSIGIGGEL